MTAVRIIPPFPVFFNQDGTALEDGYVYIGLNNQNPEAFPASVYWDEAMTVAAVQPFRTVNGRIVRSGTAANIYVDGSFSITVRDKNRVLVYASLSVSDPTDILRDELQNSLSDTAGAGQIGYDYDADYPDGTVGDALQREIWIEDKGGSPSATAATNTTAFLDAVTALRGPSVTLSTDGLGSGSFTCYISGTLRLGPGVFKISADALQFTQDLGLRIVGAGSRRMTNYIRGKTVLLVTGTSSGYGIQVKGNGARGLTLEDLDLSYETSGFTGDLLDCYSTPGVVLNRVTVCSYGITAGTRLQTARSLIRLTYDEFTHLNDVALDGAVDAIWSDDTREPSAAFSEFGGSQMVLNNVVIYDVTGRMIRHDGNRTRSGMVLNVVTFNPITLDCTRSLDLNNVEGLVMKGCAFSPSVGNKASAEWMRLVNCTGEISGCMFDDLSPAGTIDGQLVLQNNRVASTAGFTLMGGIITTIANEISAGTYGFRVTTPNYQLCLNLGPDFFKPAVTNSYTLGASQTSCKGRVNYDPDLDGSSGKWTCTNPRVTISAIDGETVSQNADLNVTEAMSGRTNELTKTGSSQLVNLHVPTGARIVHRLFKTTNQSAVVTCAGGTFYYTGGTTTSTIATWASSVVGGYLEIESYGTVGWKVIRSSGVTFS